MSEKRISKDIRFCELPRIKITCSRTLTICRTHDYIMNESFITRVVFHQKQSLN